MPDEKRYTERDLILAKREAFEEGATRVWTAFARETDACPHGWRGSNVLAAEAYPLPKSTRPRVMSDPNSLNGREWRCVGRQFETRVRESSRLAEWHLVDWSEYNRGAFVEHPLAPTPERVAMWADLLANPTEEVDS